MKHKVKYYFTQVIVCMLFINASASYKIWTESSGKEVAYLLTKHEKVFVHLDNSLYISGEDLYYKSFVVNASSHQKELQSKIIYFELLGQNGIRYMFWRSNTQNGIASGKIAIPDSVPGGVYTLRAYTNWMRNNSDAFYYSTNLLITKLNDKDLKSVKVPFPPQSKNDELEFFPEGGQLLANIANNIGIRYNPSVPGQQVISVSLKDMNDSIIGIFKTDTFGRGIMSFTPRINQIYKAFVNKDGTLVKTYDLPPVKEKGIKVEIDQNLTSLNFKISTVSGIDGPLRLLISQRGVTLKDSSFWLKNYEAITLNDKKLRSGILDINILNKYKEIIYESLYYYSNDNEILKISNVPKSEYNSNEEVALSLSTDTTNKNDTIHLTVSVSNKHPFNYIGSNSSAKEYLEYFSEIANSFYYQYTDSFTPAIANKFLLSTSPDEYYWNNKYTSENGGCYYLSENRGYIFSGRLFDGNNSQPIGKQVICLSYADSVPMINYAITDSTGAFHFLLDEKFDNKDLVLQVFSPQNENLLYKWELDDKNGTHPNPSTTQVDFDYFQLKYLDNFRKIKLINTIYSQKDKIAAPLKKVKNYNNLNFYVMHTYSVFPADYTDLENFQELSENILPGVKLKRNDNESNVYIFDSESRMMHQSPACVFLNGVPFYDIEFLAEIKSKDIYRIDVNQAQVLFGDVSFFGIVSIVTIDIQIPATYISLGRLLIKNDVKLYKVNNIDNGLKSDNGISQINSLLFLKQDVSLSSNNPQDLKFITSGLKDKYELSIQGISNNGLVVSKTYRFEVK
jgi:hypothetical protein